ncbi:FMN-binding split barrel-containing protein [Dioscorea alata]|uniref:FMN-binding split barrel-containing protein n=1 Tax=Dioscorea alata TaxID=55571 RepID=A0ACB7VZ43_DIOAL|nr:FMN-binding split barrel-containing protein [Dioscorea alata]
MLTMDSAFALGFHPGYRLSRNFSGSDSSHTVWGCRRSSSNITHRSLGGGASELNCLWNSLFSNLTGCLGTPRSNVLSTRLGALSDNAGSLPEPVDRDRKPRYHPDEEIEEDSPTLEGVRDGRLTDAETARTIIEVNSKATLLFSGMIDNAIHENIFLSDLSYLTDEHGDIYFEVNLDEDLLQTLTADEKLVQVIIGLDNLDMLPEMEAYGPSDTDLGIEEITNDESDDDDDDDNNDDDDVNNDDYEEDFVSILEDEDGMIPSEALGDWANLGTMRASHPMHFANKIAEVVSGVQLDWMDQPSASIVMRGLLRPAFVEEQKIVRKHPPGSAINGSEKHQSRTTELEKDQGLQSGTAFYKLEMVNIQLVSAYGNQSTVKIQDFRDAQPDVIAHSAANIISRLKAGGEKITEAFKAICWRHKGIKVEEISLSGVDSLGFDLRVCAGTQVQTLRFSFSAQATSEYSAERQIHDLLFPRLQNKKQMQQQAQQKEL